MRKILILGICLLLVVGCAPTDVRILRQYNGPLPRPSQILVYNFAVSPDEVKLDSGISAKLGDLVQGTPRTEEERQVGRAEAEALAKYLVEDLQALNIPVQRGWGPPPPDQHTLLLQGQFISIDEGNRTERVVIGLGAGRTEVQTYVQLLEADSTRTVLVEELESDAKSGYKPGMAETMGAGAIAGHLGASAIAGGALAGVSEVFSANVSADAKRTAKEIADKVQQVFYLQGWR